MKKKIVAQNDDHLIRLIKKEMKRHGCQCNLNHIDVSKITNMAGLFIDSDFNGDVSGWDISHVDNMAAMFAGSKFSNDLSIWKPYNLRIDGTMFLNCPATIPYWFGIKDKEERAKKIDYYHSKIEMAEELDKDLKINTTSKPEKKTKV